MSKAPRDEKPEGPFGYPVGWSSGRELGRRGNHGWEGEGVYTRAGIAVTSGHVTRTHFACVH